MSIAVMNRVRLTPVGNPHDKAVLLVLATYAWDNGTEARPSQATLALDTELSQKTVARSLARLVHRGYLSVMRPYNAAARLATVYRINLDRLAFQRLPAGAQPRSAPCAPAQPSLLTIPARVPGAPPTWSGDPPPPQLEEDDGWFTPAALGRGAPPQRSGGAPPTGSTYPSCSTRPETTKNQGEQQQPKYTAQGCAVRSDAPIHPRGRTSDAPRTEGRAIDQCMAAYQERWEQQYGRMAPALERRDWGIMAKALREYQGRAGVLEALRRFFVGDGCQTYRESDWEEHDLRAFAVLEVPGGAGALFA